MQNLNNKFSTILRIKALKDYKELLICIVATLTIFRYDALFDTFILMLFLLASYSLGAWVKIDLDTKGRILTQITIGMGILGFLMHHVLLAGIGNRTLYLTMLLAPIFFQHCKVYTLVKEVQALYRATQNKLSMYFVGGSIFVLLIMGNATITWADAISKYLSYVTYAARSGMWKTNIVESIIYADQFTMYCSLATIGVALGANRFFIWISTICMCITLLLVLEFAEIIYKKTNTLLVAATFVTIPMFLMLGTDMCIDFMQVPFLLAAMLCMANLKLDTIWTNLYAICFLCSCAIFSKLTASYIVLSIGMPVIVSLFAYIFKNRIPIRVTLCKLMGSLTCLLGGLLVPVIYGIYYMGSPVLPWLNEIFKSPYVALGNFIDPFQNNVFGINFNTLTNIILHTSRNMEIYDGYLGIFLFGLMLIPLGFVLYRNGKYIFWCILSLVMFRCAIFFTNNLRYYIVILVVFLMLVGVTLSIIGNKLSFNRKWIYRSVFGILLLVNVVPNIYIMEKTNFVPLTNSSATGIYTNETATLLKKYVPEDSWVFGQDVAFRGDWTGVLYGNSWYNDYLKKRMQEDDISYKSLLKAFDYLIMAKGGVIESEELAQIVQEADKPDSMLKRYAESENIIIYEVKDISPQEIVTYSDIEDIEINTNNSIVYKWDDLTSEYYQISFEAANKGDEDVTILYQVVYLAEDETILSREFFFIPLAKGNHHIESVDISVNHDATQALFGIYTYATENSAYINDLKVLGVKNRSYINEVVQEYYQRTPLKDRKEVE